jgi:hypothetical protein
MGRGARKFSWRAEPRHQSLTGPAAVLAPTQPAPANVTIDSQPCGRDDVHSMCPCMSLFRASAALDPGEALRVQRSSVVAVADPPATTETSRVERIPYAINLGTNEELHPIVSASGRQPTYRSRRQTARGVPP